MEQGAPQPGKQHSHGSPALCDSEASAAKREASCTLEKGQQLEKPVSEGGGTFTNSLIIQLPSSNPREGLS